MKPKSITFEEWCKMHGITEEMIEDVDVYVGCSTCQSSGHHLCECGDEHYCRSCEGTGKRKIDESNKYRVEYEIEVARAIKKFGEVMQMKEIS